MFDGQVYFDQPVRNDLITYDSIQKLQQVREMITKTGFCWTIIISKNIRRH